MQVKVKVKGVDLNNCEYNNLIRIKIRIPSKNI